jgi:dynein heavy chain
VSELAEQLKAAAAEAEYINGQEKLFGWATTKYANVHKVSASGSLLHTSTCSLIR